MFRTLTHGLLWSALLSLCLSLARPADAQVPANSYPPVVLQARVLDRQGRPVPNLPLRFSADLNGVAQRDNAGEAVMVGGLRAVATDASGLATVYPPLDAWYALPNGTPPIPHASVAPDGARCVVGALLTSDWQK